MAYKDCKILNIETGKTYYGQLDLELLNINLKEIPENLYDCCVKWDESTQAIIEDCEKNLSECKSKAQNKLTTKHIAFQEQIFPVTITKDDGITEKTFYLNCTDNTCFNIERALKRSELKGSTVFYDGIKDDSMSYNEMIQIYDAVDAVLSPSFDTKGEAKISINSATTTEEVHNIIDNIDFNS